MSWKRVSIRTKTSTTLVLSVELRKTTFCSREDLQEFRLDEIRIMNKLCTYPIISNQVVASVRMNKSAAPLHPAQGASAIYSVG